MIPPFTDLRPFVHMIKGTNVVTSDSLFEMSDTIEHADARRIASAHMQCGTDKMTRPELLPGMPHHVSCSCTVCKSAEKSTKLHNYAHALLACSHACDASLHTRMIKANIEPERKAVMSPCTFATCAHYGHQLAAEPDMVSVHPAHCKPCTRASSLLRLNPAPTGVIHRRGPHGRLLPQDAACAAANYEHLRPWLWPTDGVY